MAIQQPDGFDIFTGSDWRVTYHYILAGTWGKSHHELTVNVPMLAGDDIGTGQYGYRLWAMVLGPATSFTTTLLGILWSTSPGSGAWQPANMQPTVGGAIGHQGSREGSAVITLDAGVMDRQGSQPLFIPGFPAMFSHMGIVTDVGLRLLERVCHILVMGLTDTNSLDTGKLYSRWPVLDDAGQEVPGAYRFRRVLGFRVMQHTARAPDYRAPF